MPRARGIVAFDLDGTLVHGSTVSLHLAPWVGHDGFDQLERLYGEGRITNTEVADASAAYYEGRSRADIAEALTDIQVISGTIETTTWLKAHDLLPVIATVTWKVAAQLIADAYGFEAASGCEMGESNGRFLGTIARHFEATDKVTFVSEIAATHGLSLADVVAVGDSTSDLPLFEAADLTIALNATPDARAASDVQLDTEDLRELIPVIEQHYAR